MTTIWDDLSRIGASARTSRLDTLIKQARVENEILQIANARYEYVRRLSPRAFSELWQANLRGEGAFDDLVDWGIKNE